MKKSHAEWKWIGLKTWFLIMIDELKCNHKKHKYIIEKTVKLPNSTFSRTNIKCGKCGRRGYLTEYMDDSVKVGQINFIFSDIKNEK